MGVEHEKAFEDEICAHLAANGWLYSPTGAGYDKTRALFPEDVFAWLEETQPDEWAKIVKPSMSPAEQAKAKEQLLDRLVQDPGPAAGRRWRHAERAAEGVQEDPGEVLDVRVQAEHDAERGSAGPLRRGPGAGDAAGLLLVEEHEQHRPGAVRQRPAGCDAGAEDRQRPERSTTRSRSTGFDRDPKGEPLLGFANRCLVHFAVSNDEVG